MAVQRRINRRRLLAGAGAVAAASVTPAVFAAVPAPATVDRSGARLIPPGKMGTITFTQRDVPTRIGIAASARLGVAPTMGFLGGPDFPQDPTDLGPLVPLPGGWRELFHYLARLGF